MTGLAKQLGVSHPTWSDWESGKKTPDLDNALKIELLTNGAVPLEEWGYVREAEDARKVFAARLAVATSATIPPEAP